MTEVSPTLEFDPAAVTVELLDGLSRDRLREVIEYHHLPKQAKNATKGELLALARLAVTPTEVPADLAQGDLPGSDVVPVTLEATPSHVIPDASRFQLIVTMAEYLAKSNLTPEALRGKPNDVGSILLRANDLGIPLTSALEALYVIKGKVGMEAKLMRALVRRDGHSIQMDPANDRYQATVHGRRSDPPYDTGSATFTLDDAKDYGLIAGYDRHDDGRITIRPVMSYGTSVKPQWVTDPANMLKERASSRLCRDLFSDCLAGVSYTPDELGLIESEPTDEPHFGRAREAEPTMTIAQQRDDIAARIGDLPEDARNDIAAAWKHRNLPRVKELTPAGIRGARALLEPIEARVAEVQAKNDAIDEAEVVDGVTDSSGQEPGESGQNAAQPTTGEDGRGTVPASPGPGPDDMHCTGCGERVDLAVLTSDLAGQPWHVECYDERPM